MPISKTWTKATVKNVKEKVPQKRGVYELKSFGEVVYVGKSTNLQRRLLEHLSERNPNYFRYETVWFLGSHSRAEKKHYNRHIKKTGSPPIWNNRQP